MKSIILLLFCSLSFQKGFTQQQTPQYNISILIDLSDRIESERGNDLSVQAKKDMAIIQSIIEEFKVQFKSKGGIYAKGKLKIFFHPIPKLDSIHTIVSHLNIDLEEMLPHQKRETYHSMSSVIEQELKKLYASIISQKEYPGSDIWSFFKNDVRDYCITEDASFQNILILITDGYIFHEQSVQRIDNKTTYLTPAFINREGYRNCISIKQKFDTDHYGLLSSRDDLQNLDVLVLEISPLKKAKRDEDVIRMYLTDWFNKMEVRSLKIYNTDLPSNTGIRLRNYFKKGKNGN